MLQACVLDLKGSWDEHLPLVEFAYNNSYQESIQMEPYECETSENSMLSPGKFEFLRKGKMVILVKIRNFFRSRMMKWTLPLESFREI